MPRGIGKKWSTRVTNLAGDNPFCRQKQGAGLAKISANSWESQEEPH